MNKSSLTLIFMDFSIKFCSFNWVIQDGFRSLISQMYKLLCLLLVVLAVGICGICSVFCGCGMCMVRVWLCFVLLFCCPDCNCFCNCCSCCLLDAAGCCRRSRSSFPALPSCCPASTAALCSVCCCPTAAGCCQYSSATPSLPGCCCGLLRQLLLLLPRICRGCCHVVYVVYLWCFGLSCLGIRHMLILTCFVVVSNYLNPYLVT